MKHKKKGARLYPASKDVDLIRRKLRHITVAPPTLDWLDMGSPLLHSVLGSRHKGLPYGKMFVFTGWESHGKTLLALYIAACAQKDGARIAWLDAENSWDATWAARQGLDADQVALFAAEIVPTKKEPRLLTAEEMFLELKEWVLLQRQRDPEAKLVAVVDSVAAVLTQEEAETELSEHTMRTQQAKPMFFSRLLPRWAALCRTQNVMLILVNQLRTKPGVLFGNPEYMPGGNALKFYPGVVAMIRRVKGGKIKNKGEQIGIKGFITNLKNKVGEGSVEGKKIAFKAYFKGKMKFLPHEKLTRED